MPVTAPNTAQAFSKFANISWCKLQAANTAMDGTGTLDAAGTATTTTGHLGTLLTTSSSGPDYRVDRVRCMAEGTCVASVLRLFLNNGSSNGTAMNNVLVGEISLPAVTAANNAVVNATVKESPTPETDTAYDVTFAPIIVPAGYVLMACLGTAVASFWDVMAIGSKYA